VDHRLPDGTAWDILDARDIKEQVSAASQHEPPIVILTGHGSESIAVDFLTRGACEYVPKQELTPPRLSQAIRTALRLSRLRSEAAEAVRSAHETEACRGFLFERFPEPLLIVGTDGRIAAANPTFCRQVECSPENLKARSVSELVSADCRKEVVASLRRALEDPPPDGPGAAWQLEGTVGPQRAAFQRTTLEGRRALLIHLRPVE
jgi:PAS domain S-box-containing protein